MAATQRKNRRQEILQSLAGMLETAPGERITTAKLATEVGVSEAALYRHFPSKAKMFEGLIEFIEESLLSRINLILDDEKDTLARVHHILQLILVFAERNPGLCRILNGDALLGENIRLRGRVQSLMEKIEVQIKQVLRERALREGQGFQVSETILANMLLAYAEGRICQYVRSDFKRKPSSDFETLWSMLRHQLLTA
ncbi:nucleoid occlusion factor SlmA [Corallincola holothuriorum]|uniref:Nucleoid occlusion factor SlmA n=1 Tax=Corallincola holothuriorum TaxID=2282215 RepID=A0A368NLP0_9GAMM|nr:nucleoid occlusion factor SlmA [Corallincola holothuriorum]RCU51066.1 nucleoid occlusion factor SlmA [Corallincola holothuriorum]